MRFAFGVAQSTADRIACVGRVVNTKPNAVAFHERPGFHAMAAGAGDFGDHPLPTPTFLALGSIPRAAP